MPAPGEFYKRFKDDPEGAQREAFRIGEAIGSTLKRELNITGDDLHAIARAINAFTRQDITTVRSNTAILVNKAFCPIMISAISLNIPWKWLCPNFGWPLMRGIAHSVNPKAIMKVGSWRAEGALACEHFFEIK